MREFNTLVLIYRLLYANMNMNASVNTPQNVDNGDLLTLLSTPFYYTVDFSSLETFNTVALHVFLHNRTNFLCGFKSVMCSYANLAVYIYLIYDL